MCCAQKENVIQLRFEVLNFVTLKIRESMNMEHWRKNIDRRNRSFMTANSQMPCHAHVVPMPFPCHAVLR
jgi:hypothetical protein